MQPSHEPLAVRSAPAHFVFLWSTGFIGAKYGLPYAEPITFLMWRMGFVVAVFVLIVAIARPARLRASDIGHSAVAGSLMHVTYLGGVFTAISLGVPAGISALIPGLQPVLTATIANRFLGERVTPLQWGGLIAGLIGVLLVLQDRNVTGGAGIGGWMATLASLLGITLGSLYQKRFCAKIDWRAGNLVQYLTAFVLFALGAFLFETRVINWTADFILALSWTVLVMSVAAIGLMYWLIRRIPATRVASLFYLVPAVTALLAYLMFGEKLNLIALIGMAICAVAVFAVNYRPR
jgi:drug/metabolite transporter (DMT)-like permease